MKQFSKNKAMLKWPVRSVHWMSLLIIFFTNNSKTYMYLWKIGWTANCYQTLVPWIDTFLNMDFKNSNYYYPKTKHLKNIITKKEKIIYNFLFFYHAMTNFLSNILKNIKKRLHKYFTKHNMELCFYRTEKQQKLLEDILIGITSIWLICKPLYFIWV